jgi:hypothetical protein
MDFLVGRIESDDFVTVGGNAEMKNRRKSLEFRYLSEF